MFTQRISIFSVIFFRDELQLWLRQGKFAGFKGWAPSAAEVGVVGWYHTSGISQKLPASALVPNFGYFEF